MALLYICFIYIKIIPNIKNIYHKELRPFSGCQGHDQVFWNCKEIPRLATGIDNILSIIKGPISQGLIFDMLLNIFLRVEFWWSGRRFLPNSFLMDTKNACFLYTRFDTSGCDRIWYQQHYHRCCAGQILPKHDHSNNHSTVTSV